MAITIYHNPSCSKSRAALALLEARGIAYRVVEYLKTPPTVDELYYIVNLLNIAPRALLRASEPEYESQQVDNPELTDEQIIALMIRFPVLIERPIVVANGKACIGRPPEKILGII